jgi:hypothetical protein
MRMLFGSIRHFERIGGKAMFLGRGDSSRLSEEEKKTLDHLRRLGETGHIVHLMAEKTEVAVRAIDFFGRWEAVFALGRSVRNTGLLIGGLLALWGASQEGFIEFVRRVTGTD